MKNIIRTIILTLLLALSCEDYASAQKYVVDPFMRDSVTVQNIQLIKGKTAVGIDAFKIAKGDTVNILGQVEGWPDYGLIKKDGKEYAVSVFSSLCFADGEEVEDPWNTMTAKWRTPDGRLYSTLTPYLWIVWLVGGALLLLLVGLILKPIKVLALIFVPVMIALACYLEIRGYYTLGTDMFWWCDNDVYGFWGSVLRVIPFGLVIIGQVLSFPLYGKLAAGDFSSVGGLTPMGISFLIAVPVLLLLALIFALLKGFGILHVSNSVLNIVGTCIFIGIIVIGSMTTIILNIKLFGFLKGLWLTIFGAIYIVGAMVAVLGFLIALWHLFVQMLIAILPWLLVAFLILPGSASSSPNRDLSYEEQKAKDEIEAKERKKKADFFDRARRINEAPFIKGGLGKDLSKMK